MKTATTVEPSREAVESPSVAPSEPVLGCYGKVECPKEGGRRWCNIGEACEDIAGSMEPDDGDPDETSDEPTVTLSAGGETTEPVSVDEFLSRLGAIAADPTTGEVFSQPTLDATIFPAVEREAVPMVKVTLSGTVEMTQAEFQSYCDQGLEPGRVVKLALTGYLPNPHARWVKRTEKDEETGRKDSWWEQEAAIKVKALELGSFELRGIYSEE